MVYGKCATSAQTDGHEYDGRTVIHWYKGQRFTEIYLIGKITRSKEIFVLTFSVKLKQNTLNI